MGSDSSLYPEVRPLCRLWFAGTGLAASLVDDIAELGFSSRRPAGARGNSNHRQCRRVSPDLSDEPHRNAVGCSDRLLWRAYSGIGGLYLYADLPAQEAGKSHLSTLRNPGLFKLLFLLFLRLGCIETRRDCSLRPSRSSFTFRPCIVPSCLTSAIESSST